MSEVSHFCYKKQTKIEDKLIEVKDLEEQAVAVIRALDNKQLLIMIRKQVC